MSGSCCASLKNRESDYFWTTNVLAFALLMDEGTHLAAACVSFLTQSIFCSVLVSWWVSWFISSLLTDPDLFVSEAQITGNETVTFPHQSSESMEWFCPTLVVLQLQTNRSRIYLRLSLLSASCVYLTVWADLLPHLHRLDCKSVWHTTELQRENMPGQTTCWCFKSVKLLY